MKNMIQIAKKTLASKQHSRSRYFRDLVGAEQMDGFHHIAGPDPFGFDVGALNLFALDDVDSVVENDVQYPYGEVNPND